MPTLTSGRRGIISLVFALASIAGLTLACDAGVTATPRPTATPTRPAVTPTAEMKAPLYVEFIIVHPDAMTLEVGQSQQFTVTAFDQFENPIPNPQLTYVHENLDGSVRMSCGGFFTGIDPGAVVVTATARHGGVARSATANVTMVAVEAAAISAGRYFTCAVTTVSGVKCWGRRYGDEERDVRGLTSGIKAVSVGGGHACALTTAGGVKCWGDGGYGRIGKGMRNDNTGEVVGLNSGVTAVSAGWHHTCAVTTVGEVKCWGRYNRLGIVTTTHHSTPVGVSGLSGGVADVSAGGEHTCALTTSGGVKCWGDNRYGMLGNGTNTASATPVDVIGLEGQVAAVSVEGGPSSENTGHSCAVTKAGGVKCWGNNFVGQLGVERPAGWGLATPVDVTGLTTRITAVTTGYGHTCVLTEAGGVKCWGLNAVGQLGDGATADRSNPANVVGLSRGISAVSAGWGHTSALTQDGGVKCWGYGYGSTPVGVFPFSSGVDNSE